MDTTAIAAIIIGLGATFAAMVMPMKYPNAPTWAISTFWYGGIFLMLGGIVYLGWVWITGIHSNSEITVGTKRASMEVLRWEFDTPDPRRSEKFLANLYVINRGSEDAIELRNDGIVIFESPDVAAQIIDEYFGQLKSQIFSQSIPAFAGPVHPGQSSVWFSVYANQPSVRQFNDIKSGKVVPFALGVMKYRDKTIPRDKFIYTESCAYKHGNGVPVLCSRGENRSYIAD